MSKQELNTPQKSGEIRHDEKSVTISESRLLVPLGKSKKLAALRKQSQTLQTSDKNPVPSDEIASSAQNKEVNELILSWLKKYL